VSLLLPVHITKLLLSIIESCLFAEIDNILFYFFVNGKDACHNTFSAGGKKSVQKHQKYHKENKNKKFFPKKV
jgi:hypothetical protein